MKLNSASIAAGFYWIEAAEVSPDIGSWLPVVSATPSRKNYPADCEPETSASDLLPPACPVILFMTQMLGGQLCPQTARGAVAVLEYEIFFLGVDGRQLGRPTLVNLHWDEDASSLAIAFGSFFGEGAEIWQGSRLVHRHRRPLLAAE